MRRGLVAALAAAALAPVTGCGAGARGAGSDVSGTAKGVEVIKAWARTTPPGVSVGAVYLTAKSDGADTLTGADVDPTIAAKAELHTESTTGSGETSMAPAASMPVTKQDPLVLDPLGSHLMLVDLAGPLSRGEQFDVTLHFAKGGDAKVRVEVRDQAP